MPFTETLTTIFDGESAQLRRELEAITNAAKQADAALANLNQRITVDTSQAIQNLEALLATAQATAAALAAINAASGATANAPAAAGNPRAALPAPLAAHAATLPPQTRNATYLANRRG